MRLISSTRTSCYVEMIAIITLSLSNLHCYVGLRKFYFVITFDWRVLLTYGDCFVYLIPVRAPLLCRLAKATQGSGPARWKWPFRVFNFTISSKEREALILISHFDAFTSKARRCHFTTIFPLEQSVSARLFKTNFD